jgi:hypothetical protein
MKLNFLFEFQDYMTKAQTKQAPRFQTERGLELFLQWGFSYSKDKRQHYIPPETNLAITSI